MQSCVLLLHCKDLHFISVYTVVCPYPGHTFQTPSGCLKPPRVPNPVYTMFFSPYVYISVIKFNLYIRHSKRLTIITNNKIEQYTVMNVM